MAQDAPPTTLPTPTEGAEIGAGELASSLMNDLTAAPSPAPAAPEPPVAPEPAGDKPPTPAPAPEPKPVAKADPKPAAPAAKPATAPKPSAPVNFDDPKLNAADLRRHLKELQTKLTTTVAEKETALTQSNKRLAELEKKRFWTDDDQKKWDELTKGKASLEADLYGRNYADSPEYKRDYVDKLNSQAHEAVEVMAALQVKFVDEETGEEKFRAGSEQDMMRLYKAANNVERRKLAKDLFGEDFQEALDAVRPMLDTQRSAAEAIKTKRENYQSELTEKAKQIEQFNSQIGQFVQTASEHLRTSQPDVFGEDENDPNVAVLLNKGFSFVDEATSNADKLSINERAGRIALIRSMAGAFPRLVADKRKMAAQIASLNEELAKYRGSDPGAGGGAGGGGTSSGSGSSDDLAAEIDKLNQK